MYCPACGSEIFEGNVFCRHCGVFLGEELIRADRDLSKISKARTQLLQKAKEADKGSSPGVWALCAAWRVATRDAFDEDVNGYVSGTTTSSLAVMVAIIAGEENPERVRSYENGSSVPWHRAMTTDHSPGKKEYLKDAVEFGGKGAGILPVDREVTDKIGPLLRRFLPALIVSYNVDLTKAYEKHSELVGRGGSDYAYSRLD
jgi:hypothetical protein